MLASPQLEVWVQAFECFLLSLLFDCWRCCRCCRYCSCSFCGCGCALSVECFGVAVVLVLVEWFICCCCCCCCGCSCGVLSVLLLLSRLWWLGLASSCSYGGGIPLVVFSIPRHIPNGPSTPLSILCSCPLLLPAFSLAVVVSPPLFWSEPPSRKSSLPGACVLAVFECWGSRVALQGLLSANSFPAVLDILLLYEHRNRNGTALLSGLTLNGPNSWEVSPSTVLWTSPAYRYPHPRPDAGCTTGVRVLAFMCCSCAYLHVYRAWGLSLTRVSLGFIQHSRCWTIFHLLCAYWCCWHVAAKAPFGDGMKWKYT